jgi:hypothetical protein
MRRPRRTGIVCLALAAAIALAAVLDHDNKAARMNRAERSEWYCEHLATRCHGPSSASIERHWNEREAGYKIAFGALVVSGVLCLALRDAAGQRRLDDRPVRTEAPAAETDGARVRQG